MHVRSMSQYAIYNSALVSLIVSSKAVQGNCNGHAGAEKAPGLRLPPWLHGLCSEGSAAELQHLPMQRDCADLQKRSKKAQECLGYPVPSCPWHS